MIYKVATMMAMFGAAAAEHWAVIVAGSAGYGNYRHQADACHAYQVVTAGGIKPENVILLAVDDIANNDENPVPGKLFNKPTPKGTPGVDVYDGCVIDYSGEEVTPETFTKVLTGQGDGKVHALSSHASPPATPPRCPAALAARGPVRRGGVITRHPTRAAAKSFAQPPPRSDRGRCSVRHKFCVLITPRRIADALPILPCMAGA